MKASVYFIMYRFSVFRRLCCIILVCLCIAAAAPSVFAAEQPQILITPQTEQAVRGKKYRVDLRFRGDADVEISAFRLNLTYDERYLLLTDIEGPAGSGAAEFQYHTAENTVSAVFASLKQPVSLSDGICCTLVFTVKEDAAVGSASMEAVVDQLVDSDLNPIDETCAVTANVTMERLLSEDARLAALEPSYGTLQPAFSPDITEYTLSVPYEVKQLTFTAEPMDNASYRINRKNLNAGGKTTTFLIHVKSENEKNQTEYVVTATRGKKETGSSKKENTKESAEQPVNNSDPAQNHNAQYGSRTINYHGSQYAVFVLGIAVAVICVLLILLICMKHKNKPKHKNNSGTKH